MLLFRNFSVLGFFFMFAFAGFAQETTVTRDVIKPSPNEKAVRIKRKYNVEVKLPSIQIGEGTPMLIANVDIKEKIKYETSLVQINDSIAVRLQMTRSQENKVNTVYYRLRIYYKEKAEWKPVGKFHFEPIGPSIGYSGMTVGGHSNIPKITLDGVYIKIY